MSDEQTGPGSDEPFTYETPHGTLTVPSLSKMPMGLIRKTRKLPAAEQMFTILESIVPPEAMEIVDQMTAVEFADFQDAWQQHSGVDAGESPAS